MTKSIFEVTEADGKCSAAALGETYKRAGHGC